MYWQFWLFEPCWPLAFLTAVVAVAAAPLLVAVQSTVDAAFFFAAVTLGVAKELLPLLPKEPMLMAHPLQEKQILCPNSMFLD